MPIWRSVLRSRNLTANLELRKFRKAAAVARRFHKPEVEGSNPSPATRKPAPRMGGWLTAEP